MTDREIGLIILLFVSGAALIYLPMIFMGIRGYVGWRVGRATTGMMGYGRGPLFLIGLAAIVLVAIGAYLFLSGSRALMARPKGRAIEILNERYAKGEITREEYARMKEELGR